MGKARIGWTALAASVWVAPASAAVIATGSYQADELVSVSAATVAPVPGRYRFDLTLGSAPSAFFGEVTKTITDTFFCIDPDNPGPPFYCAGDDVPQAYLLEAVSPTLYSAPVVLGPAYFIYNPDGSYRYHGEDCCSAMFEFQSVAAGTYTLSVTQVPEPASWALMIGGMGLTGGVFRRRVRAEIRSRA